MVSMTKAHPKIAPMQHGSAKSNVYKKDCTTCKHEVGYECGRKDIPEKELAKMAMEQCHSDNGKKKSRGKSVTNLKV